MNLVLEKSKIQNNFNSIQITGSKSEANRLLILQALFDSLKIVNLSNSDDTKVLQQALKSSSNKIDVHHAGTAMRFLTAYFSIQNNREVELTGSSRMKERPIGVLVDALRELGADITYKEKDGFPPLVIKGKVLNKSKVSLQANVSSQYISALLLIASMLENGLELTLEGELTSVPYINMSLKLLNEVGIETSFKGNKIEVKPTKEKINTKTLTVESDWSSASYFYSLVAMSAIGTSIQLSSYKEDSLQGDSCLSEIYRKFGVKTEFTENSIQLTKTESNLNPITLNLNDSPDIAQTIAVSCFGLGLPCDLYGLHTLKIKETDRLEALKNELTKLGAPVSVTADSLHLKASKIIISDVKIDTYQDHRMAMAFASLSLKTSLIINDSDVVSKSYPSFWADLKSIGIQINEI